MPILLNVERKASTLHLILHAVTGRKASTRSDCSGPFDLDLRIKYLLQDVSKASNLTGITHLRFSSSGHRELDAATLLQGHICHTLNGAVELVVHLEEAQVSLVVEKASASETMLMKWGWNWILLGTYLSGEICLND